MATHADGGPGGPDGAVGPDAKPGADAGAGDCSVDNGGCSPDAYCIPHADGTRDCTCHQGFHGDGFTCSPTWTLVHSEPVQLGFWYHAVGATDGRIYFSRDSNDGTQFFKSFQASAGGMVRDEPTMLDSENDLCACGYNSELVQPSESPDRRIYYFANYGHAFDTIAETWVNEPYPPDFMRGEAAVAAVGTDIYYVGGRGPLSTVDIFDTVAENWYPHGFAPEYPIAVSDAHAGSWNNTLYVIGGRDSAGGPVRAFNMYEGGGWVGLPDAPVDNINSVVVYGDQLWALDGTTFHIFDLAPRIWLPDMVELPANTRAIPVVVNGDLWVVDAAMGSTRFLHYTP